MTKELLLVDGVPRWFQRLIHLWRYQFCRRNYVHEVAEQVIKTCEIPPDENLVTCKHCGQILWKRPIDANDD